MAAKFKLTLAPLPDFNLPVVFQMPNGERAEMSFKVRHIKASEVQELYVKEGVKDSDFILKVATGWNLPEEFNEENAIELIGYYPAAAIALTQAYLSALAGQRAKN